MRLYLVPLLYAVWTRVGAAPATPTLSSLAAGEPTLVVELTPLHASEALHQAQPLVTFEGSTYAARVVRRQLGEGVTVAEGATEGEACEEDLLQPGDPEFLSCLLWVFALITTAGLMAGCTMGVLSLDPLLLKLKQLEGSEDEKRWANAVLPVLESHHQLLVALLLCNAGANEALPIFLDKLVDEKTAIVLSVSCVLIFGEILPSAVMTGPHQLRIAAALAPAIRVLLLLTSPISWPMAKCLDHWLGHQDGMTRFKRKEFKALIKLQHRAKGWEARAKHRAAQRGRAPVAGSAGVMLVDAIAAGGSAAAASAAVKPNRGAEVVPLAHPIEAARPARPPALQPDGQ